MMGTESLQKQPFSPCVHSGHSGLCINYPTYKSSFIAEVGNDSKTVFFWN